MEQSITGMRNIIIRHKKEIIAEHLDDEVRTQVEDLSAVVLQLK